jgi:hypothetical protein
MSPFRLLLASFAFFSIAVAAYAQKTRIDAIGQDPVRRVVPEAISADGRVVVGYSYEPSEAGSRAFRWSAAGGYQPAIVPGEFVTAQACSADGKLVVGNSDGTPFLWTPGGLQPIPQQGDLSFDQLYCCSADGAALFGGVPDDGMNLAARFKNGQMEVFGATLIGFGSPARCSADGTTLAGSYLTQRPDGYWDFPAIWREGAGVLRIGSLPGMKYGYARACSPDGSVVVGTGATASGRGMAFYWTAGTGMRELPIFPNVSPAYYWADPRCVTKSGIVMGEMVAGAGARRGACFWIGGKGPYLWADVLKRDYGVDLEALGWVELLGITDCTPDGRTMTGYGSRPSEGVGQRTGFRIVLGAKAPKARAGKNVIVAAASERGVKVRLDGSQSFDPEGGVLRYRWSAPRVKFADPTSPKPVATFPVGRTTVTLTVTGKGVRASDTVDVVVRLKRAKPRPHGRDADDAFAAAATQAHGSMAGAAGAEAAATGFVYASVAASLGAVAGDVVRWEESQSYDEAFLSYAEARDLQRRYGQAAALELLAAYAATGDENLLSAYRDAASGAACVIADLSER